MSYTERVNLFSNTVVSYVISSLDRPRTSHTAGPFWSAGGAAFCREDATSTVCTRSNVFSGCRTVQLPEAIYGLHFHDSTTHGGVYTLIASILPPTTVVACTSYHRTIVDTMWHCNGLEDGCHRFKS